MTGHSFTPARLYMLFDLEEDFYSGMSHLMSLGFSVHHIVFELNTAPPDVLSGDPPPDGFSRFQLSWSAPPRFSLSPQLHQALLDRFPVRAVTHRNDTAAHDWSSFLQYALLALRSGEV